MSRYVNLICTADKCEIIMVAASIVHGIFCSLEVNGSLLNNISNSKHKDQAYPALVKGR
jgi:hypothetical protein